MDKRLPHLRDLQAIVYSEAMAGSDRALLVLSSALGKPDRTGRRLRAANRRKRKRLDRFVSDLRKDHVTLVFDPKSQQSTVQTTRSSKRS